MESVGINDGMAAVSDMVVNILNLKKHFFRFSINNYSISA